MVSKFNIDLSRERREHWLNDPPATLFGRLPKKKVPHPAPEHIEGEIKKPFLPIEISEMAKGRVDFFIYPV